MDMNRTSRCIVLRRTAIRGCSVRMQWHAGRVYWICVSAMCLVLVAGGIATAERAVAASPGDDANRSTVPRSYVIADYDGPVQVHGLNPIAGTNGGGQVYSNTLRAIGVFDPAQDILSQALTVYVPGAFGGENWVADPVNMMGTVAASASGTCAGASAEVLFAGGGSDFDATVCVFDTTALGSACGANGGDITGLAIACGTAFGLDGDAIHLVSIPVSATLSPSIAVYAHVSTNDAGVVLGGDVEIGFSTDGATIGSSGPACAEGGDISGGNATVSSNLWANVFCEPEMTMRLEAVEADGAECANPTDPSQVGACEWHKEGTKLILRFPGQNIRVEAFVSNFGGGDFCTATGTACDNTIDIFDRTCSNNGAMCDLDGDCRVCSDDGFPCVLATDCAGFPAAQCNQSGATCDDDCSGKFCSDASTVCNVDADCAGIGAGDCGITNDCGESIGTYQFGLDCDTFDSGNAGALVPIATPCAGVFDFCTGVDTDRTDFYYRQCLDSAFGVIEVAAFGLCPDGSPGGHLLGTVSFANCFPGDTGEAYGGQFLINAPSDTAGKFYLGISGAPAATTAVNPQFVNFVPIELIPAVINVQTGSCCFNQPNVECVEGRTIAECDAVNGVFTAGGTCTVNCAIRPLAENYFGTCRLGGCAVDGAVTCASDLDCEALAGPTPGSGQTGIFCGTPGGSRADADQDCRFVGPGEISPAQAFCIPNLAGAFPGRCYVAKNRYLSINPNPLNSGTLTARRVSFTPPAGGAPQVIGWVGPPFEKISGIQPFAGFPNEEPNVFISNVQASPHFMDWSTVGATVHVTGCGIRPGFGTKSCTGDNATPCLSNDDCTSNGVCAGLGMLYGIQSIPQGADLVDEASYSAALELRTVGKWGDTAGSFLFAGQLRPPNDAVNGQDIFTVVTVFTAVNEGVSIIWADLKPRTPDQFANLDDIFGAIEGFVSDGTWYPYTADPCDCLGGCPPPGP